MATIIRHPQVEDYFVELTLDQIRQRPGGIADLYEENRLILLKDYRLPVDLDVLQKMSGNLARVEDPKLRKTLKKLTSTKFFEGADAVFSDDDSGASPEPEAHEAPDAGQRSLLGRLKPTLKRGAPSQSTPVAGSSNPSRTRVIDLLETSDPVRRAVYDVLCNGDADLFAQASRMMKRAHEAAMDLFQICFPTYQYFRIVPSVRLTTTLFENIHWDNHGIAEDFQQVRIFCNLDQRPRIWHTSHRFVTYLETIYSEHRLERFAGRDPNELNDYVCGKVLGGTRGACTDNLPRHVIAFDPGEVWFGESRILSHQIFYGERAMVYMFFVHPEGMLRPERRFNEQVRLLHERMAAFSGA